jgi:hypothetical protein
LDAETPSSAYSPTTLHSPGLAVAAGAVELAGDENRLLGGHGKPGMTVSKVTRRTMTTPEASVAFAMCQPRFDQQYLAKNPFGYRCHANTGVTFPATA